MLTPQEVSERAFAKASFGGYNMNMVDEFLDTLTEDYTALYKENAALKAKMKVLVEKVEEYRATDDVMRKTLLAAQNMADELVREAENKKAEMLSKAEGEARVQLENIRRELVNEEARLTAARNATTVYVAKVRELYQKELEHLDALSVLTVPQAETPKADPVAAAVAEIESNMSRMMEAEQDAEDEVVEAPLADGEEEEDTLSFQPVAAGKEAADEPDEEANSGRLDLNNLRFGKDFEL